MKPYKLTKTKSQLIKLIKIITLIEKAHDRVNDSKAILYSYDSAKDDYATVRLFCKRDDLVENINKYNLIINRLNAYYRNQLNEL